MLDFLFSLRALEALYLPAALAAALVAWSPVERRPAPAGIAIAVAFLIGFLTIRPYPIWPPAGAEGWLPYLTSLLLGFALFADLPRFRLAASLPFVIAMPILITIAVGHAALGGIGSGRGLLLYPLLSISGIIIFSRLVVIGGRRSGGIALLAPTLGLVLLAADYGSRIWLLALPLLAAILGALVAANRLGRPWPLSASMTGGGLWFGFAALMIAKRDLLALPTAILFLGFLLPEFADWLAPRRGPMHLAILACGGFAVVALSQASFAFG